MTHVIIEAQNLTKYYGKIRGIEDLNFQINEGELFGFLGPNGAGKSTTIRLLLNLIMPTSGKVFLFGKEVRKNYQNLFKRIGNIPGELQLYEELTGNYFLEYMNSFNNKEPVLREELSEAFKLNTHDLDKKIKHYSRGMKQKIGIIQAMQEKPDLLIMDEPSEGLDPLNKNVLYEYLIRLKEEGKTVFFSSHNLTEVEKISDRVGLVREGRFVALESISELKKKMVRKMEVEFLEEYNLTEFNLPSIEIIEQDKNRLVVTVLGDINPLLQKLTQYKIKNMIFPEPSLEDMFLTYY